MDDLILKTKRLVLEPLKVRDAEAIWPYVSDPEISKLMSWEAHTSIEQTRAFLKDVESRFEQGQAISWGVKFENKIVGVFSIISILKTHRHLTFNKAELAYWIGREYQGKGFMAESGEAVLEYAFNELKLHKIYVGHHEGNTGSENLIKRLNFSFTHLEREAFRKYDNWINVHYYELLEKEYFKLHNHE
jgi:[ribosomal protein S5]-alanine N-acetyltransferase